MAELATTQLALPVFKDPGSGELSLRHDGSPPGVMRRRIDALTQFLLSLKGEHRELPVEHYVADGMYMRKLFIPKGTLLVGKIHRKDCMNVVASGSITVLTELGCRRIDAGFTAVSPAGLQKVGLAHEDTVFVNVFRTDEVEIESIEVEIAATHHIDELPNELLRELPCL